MDKPELLATVFSDYICPFCYIGLVRLDRLRDSFDLKINWCFLEVHPETPADTKPIERLPYGEDLLQQKLRRVAQMARAEGLHFAPMTRTTNSHQAMLLAEAAKDAGREIFYTLHRRLYEAYFGSGENIGSRPVLERLARECGVSEEYVRQAWSNTRYEKRLKQNLALAAELRIVNTPTYVIGEQVIPGAVPTEALYAAAQVAQDAH
jgi:predicted DsbA family dithiol-disulfide isomerase